MNVLIIGSGGREHAIAWKISQSKKLTNLYIAPGNAGTAELGKNINIGVNDFEKIKNLILSEKIEMLIVGPEGPLVKGIYDYLASQNELKNLIIIGPSQKGAQLEGSKEFAKEFMVKYNIPTAKYKSFNKSQFTNAINFLNELKPPYVLKADGLAAGKGVLILNTIAEASKELKEMFEGKFGSAGDKVVIEEFLTGIEASSFVITDGKNYKILPEAKDYKRIGENDTGLNTGGMGAVSPVPFVNEELKKKIEEKVIKPTIEGLQKEKITYCGFIFFGLMINNNEPYVIEYNVRMGDPETEVVFPRIKSDILEILSAIPGQKLNTVNLEVTNQSATTVMMVSGGYPGSYEKGKEISFSEISDSIIFHAGTKLNDSKVLTNGGRVIAVTSYGLNFKEALQKSYENIKNINFENCYYRKDIGFDL